MGRLLDWIGYASSLEEKNKYTYFITGIGVFQLIFFLGLYLHLDNAAWLVAQTCVMLGAYLSSFYFLKIKCFFMCKSSDYTCHVITSFVIGVVVVSPRSVFRNVLLHRTANFFYSL